MRRFLHPQERETTCAMAAVRTVLHKQFGLRISESALVALGNTPEVPILVHGSSTREIRKAVRGASKSFNTGKPWTLRTHTQGTMRSLVQALKRGRWPIVEVFDAGQMAYHAIVVLAIKDEVVQYFDPGERGKPVIKRLSKEKFLEMWYSPETGHRWWALINGGELKDVP